MAEIEDKPGEPKERVGPKVEQTPPPIEPKPQPQATVIERHYSVQDLLVLIAAIGVVLANVVTIYKAEQTNEKVEAVKQEATRSGVATEKKLDVIHDATNSNLTDVKNELERASGEIELLKKLLVEEKSTNEEKEP